MLLLLVVVVVAGIKLRAKGMLRHRQCHQLVSAAKDKKSNLGRSGSRSRKAASTPKNTAAASTKEPNFYSTGAAPFTATATTITSATIGTRSTATPGRARTMITV